MSEKSKHLARDCNNLSHILIRYVELILLRLLIEITHIFIFSIDFKMNSSYTRAVVPILLQCCGCFSGAWNLKDNDMINKIKDILVKKKMTHHLVIKMLIFMIMKKVNVANLEICQIKCFIKISPEPSRSKHFSIRI